MDDGHVLRHCVALLPPPSVALHAGGVKSRPAAAIHPDSRRQHFLAEQLHRAFGSAARLTVNMRFRAPAARGGADLRDAVVRRAGDGEARAQVVEEAEPGSSVASCPARRWCTSAASRGLPARGRPARRDQRDPGHDVGGDEAQDVAELLQRRLATLAHVEARDHTRRGRPRRGRRRRAPSATPVRARVTCSGCRP